MTPSRLACCRRGGGVLGESHDPDSGFVDEVRVELFPGRAVAQNDLSRASDTDQPWMPRQHIVGSPAPPTAGPHLGAVQNIARSRRPGTYAATHTSDVLIRIEGHDL